MQYEPRICHFLWDSSQYLMTLGVKESLCIAMTWRGQFIIIIMIQPNINSAALGMIPLQSPSPPSIVYVFPEPKYKGNKAFQLLQQ